MVDNKLKPGTEEVTTERKVPLYKRLGRSFRHIFQSFRTGTGPQQRTTNDKFMEGQLGEFVQSCNETTLTETGLAEADHERENNQQQDWEKIGAKPKTSKITATVSTPYSGPQEDIPQEQARATRNFNIHLDKAGPLLNYNRDSEEERLRNPLTDEEAFIALESLLLLHPFLNTPSKVFEFLNLHTGYTPVQPRSYNNSKGSQASSEQPPAPPHRLIGNTLPPYQEKLVDVPTPDFTTYSQTSSSLLKLNA
ncbi:hypothetical protein OUZ56_005662 [Daphnia magna]|uniref:Uncharacterized protein n=1 Tax=Daphnia magna TaxID=35525 RepID=A0ABQ9YTE8_9CRUS|nr:hypothetical protein OUZ56_005662 [Daphnia magna]